MPVTINTQRLILRQWCEADLPLFAKMSRDKEVMACFPSLLSREKSDQMAGVIQSLIEQRGWGLWAVEERGGDAFIGFVGLHRPNFQLPVSDCTEIGWRLARQHWGKGYATEAAKACLEFAFQQLNKSQIVAFASMQNRRSISVMLKIGMENLQMPFKHPDFPEGHALSEHVLYKIEKQDWIKKTKSV